MKLGGPIKIEIKPNAGKTEFRFLLTFPASPRTVEFLLDDAGTMYLMVALQRLQARHKIPIPANVRPSGRPKLSIVTDDE